MITKATHFTLTDRQLEVLVEALDFAMFHAEGYLEYLREEAPHEENADVAELEDDADIFADDMAQWEWLHSTLKGLVVARPKLSIKTPYNPEHN